MEAKDQVNVISLDDVAKINLGNNSWSALMATQKTGNCKKIMIGYSIFTPNTDTPQKIHEEEEVAYIVKGHGSLMIGDQEISYGPGCALSIPAGVPHGVRNFGSEDLEMVFAFSYPEYPPTKDA